ncbi:flagellar hook-length control protein FliK [Sphingopyxis sp. PET50]|uniref:flagellar hook-length control protein FliK n=1 Tax=Sphingopyxis sp. PET50 TaxID=2976533 RepID=UPI0021AF1B2E|nr:flagellar hook-length control protein FliK [Sphingopyxis sp. PET50]
MIEPRAAAKLAAEAAPRRDEQPAPPMAAPRVRDAAASLPAATFASAEAPVAKPADEASMTILFAQPATQTAAIAEAAKPVAIAERVLDLTSDDAWIEQLASDIAATKSATNEVSFRLMPRHLGRLDVSMLAGDEGVSLKLDTQHEATATIVTAAQVRLVDDLRQQGVRVTETQVTHTPDQAGRQSQQGQGRSPAQDAAHLIETATARTELRETDDQERAGDRRGRFA